jgi:hypothetical protein
MAEKTGFEKWLDGIRKAPGDPRWHIYDCTIRSVVSEYNRHLSGTTGYIPLDWQYVKAMLWAETGPNKAQWKIRPIQIGNPGDPGLGDFFDEKGGGDLILPPRWSRTLVQNSARISPEYNIVAGVGYLLMKMANFSAPMGIVENGARPYEVEVRPGDNFDRIAKREGSTPDVIKTLNPGIDPLRLKPGQKVKCQKASMRRIIRGWKRISTSKIAEYYNVGDSMYTKKLDSALEIIRKGEVAVCSQ